MGKTQERLIQVSSGVLIVALTYIMILRMSGDGGASLPLVALYLTGVIHPLIATRRLLRHASVDQPRRRELLYSPLLVGLPAVMAGLSLMR